MAERAGGYRGEAGSVLADFAGLLGRAILSGIAASLILALLTLVLASSASAQTMPDGWAVESLPERFADLCPGESIALAPDQPAPEDTIVVSGTRGTLPRSLALTLSPSNKPTSVGALWAMAWTNPVKVARARAKPTSPIPQSDTESTLQIALGLLALATAGMVVLVGRAVPAGGHHTGDASR